LPLYRFYLTGKADFLVAHEVRRVKVLLHPVAASPTLRALRHPSWKYPRKVFLIPFRCPCSRWASLCLVHDVLADFFLRPPTMDKFPVAEPFDVLSDYFCSPLFVSCPGLDPFHTLSFPLFFFFSWVKTCIQPRSSKDLLNLHPFLFL